MACLKICPECESELENIPSEEYQRCKVCGYWTKKGTARLEPILIMD